MSENDMRCLRESLLHVRFAREDVLKGDLSLAMCNLISANRLHAMSRVHGTGSWRRVECVLRNAQRRFWAVVRPLPAFRGHA
jgi:hypothetical protein